MGVSPSWSDLYDTVMGELQEEDSLAVPDEYVVVPVEATDLMVDAGYGAFPDCKCTEGDKWRAKLVYKAMLSAAQQGTPHEQLHHKKPTTP